MLNMYFLICRVHVGDTANVVTFVAMDSHTILSAPVVIHHQVCNNLRHAKLQYVL